MRAFIGIMSTISVCTLATLTGCLTNEPKTEGITHNLYQDSNKSWFLEIKNSGPSSLCLLQRSVRSLEDFGPVEVFSKADFDLIWPTIEIASSPLEYQEAVEIILRSDQILKLRIGFNGYDLSGEALDQIYFETPVLYSKCNKVKNRDDFDQRILQYKTLVIGNVPLQD